MGLVPSRFPYEQAIECSTGLHVSNLIITGWCVYAVCVHAHICVHIFVCVCYTLSPPPFILSREKTPREEPNTLRAAGILAVRRVGPVTERSLV